MIGRFRPVTGVMEVGIGQFTLPGNNAGFCAAILQKSGVQAPMRLESLTYVRPFGREAAPQPHQQPLVVNLLMQLRAYYDQSNTYLRNQAALNLQLTNQLRQVLTLSSGPVRAQAGAIQRAVRENLYRDGEFQRALDSLAREVKKNGDSAQTLTVRLPGSQPASSGTGGRQFLVPGDVLKKRQLEGAVLRNSFIPEGEKPALTQRNRGVDSGSVRRGESAMVHRSPSGGEGRDGAPRVSADDTGRSRKGGRRKGATSLKSPNSRTADQVAQKFPTERRETDRSVPTSHVKEKGGAPTEAARTAQLVQAVRIPSAGRRAEPAREDGSAALQNQPAWQQNREKTTLAVPSDRSYPTGTLGRMFWTTGSFRFSRSFLAAAQPFTATALLSGNYRFPESTAIFKPVRFNSAGQMSHGAETAVPLPNRLVASFGDSILWRQTPERISFFRPHETVSSSREERAESRGENAAAAPAAAFGGAGLPGNGLIVPDRMALAGARMAVLTRAPFLQHADPAGPISRSSATKESDARGVLAPRLLRSTGDVFPGVGRQETVISEGYTVGPPVWVLPSGRTVFSGQAGPMSRSGTAKERSPRGLLVPRLLRSTGETAAVGGVSPGLGRQGAVISEGHTAGTPAWGLPAGRAVFSGSFTNLAAVPPILAKTASAFLTGERSHRVASQMSYVERNFPASVQLIEQGGRLTWTTPPLRLPDSAKSVPAGRSSLSRMEMVNAVEEGISGTAVRISRETFPLRAPLSGRSWRDGVFSEGHQSAAASNSSRIGLVGAGVGVPRVSGRTFPPLFRRGLGQPGQSLSAAVVPDQTMGMGGQLIQIQQAVRHILEGGSGGAVAVIRRARQVSMALSGLEIQAGPLRQRAAPLSKKAAVPVLHLTSSSESPRTAGIFSPMRQAAGQRDTAAAPDILSRATQERTSGVQAAPQIIYRSPERRSDSPSRSDTGESSGEAILQAQTVSPAKAAAMNAAYSYPPGGQGSGNPAASAMGPLTREQEERITQRVLEDINYNRMASEVLDRVERRLRAERRKFGR